MLEAVTQSESRLSDIPLKWMVDELREAAPDIKVDENKLYIYPSALGIQHDEIAARLNMWPWWIPKSMQRILTWRKEVRDIHYQAELHPTVIERFSASAVSYLGYMKEYRPEILREHQNTQSYY